MKMRKDPCLQTLRGVLKSKKGAMAGKIQHASQPPTSTRRKRPKVSEEQIIKWDEILHKAKEKGLSEMKVIGGFVKEKMPALPPERQAKLTQDVVQLFRDTRRKYGLRQARKIAKS